MRPRHECHSQLYQMLRDKTRNRLGSVVLDGFSIYEVDGVFYRETLWEQRTLVIRILLVRKTGTPLDLLDVTVLELGREIATKVAGIGDFIQGTVSGGSLTNGFAAILAIALLAVAVDKLFFGTLESWSRKWS